MKTTIINDKSGLLVVVEGRFRGHQKIPFIFQGREVPTAISMETIFFPPLVALRLEILMSDSLFSSLELYDAYT